MRKRAFTMIELIIALAILAILVIGLWVLIDPIEQMAKANDGAKQNNAKELLDAIQRYTVSNGGEYPWNNAGMGNSRPDAAYTSDSNGVLMDDWVPVLVEAGEIKEGAATKLTGGDYVVLKGTGATSLIHVCFQPESQSMRLQAAEKCGTNERFNLNSYPLCVTTDGSVPGEGPSQNYTCVF